MVERTDRMVREEEAADMTGLSRSARYALEKRGLFPARRIIVGRHTGWLLSELSEWLRSRPRAAGPSSSAPDSTAGA